MTQALDALTSVLNLSPQGIDETHDYLRLLGIVLGQLALLEVVCDPKAEAKDKVSAARILTSIKESPEAIAERLRRSPFTGMSMEDLKELVGKISSGDAKTLDITQLASQLKKE